MAPKRDIDHAYDINRLNMFFALSSIVLFVFFVWMMWADFHRDWKYYQAQFRKIDRAKTEQAKEEEIGDLQNNAEYQGVREQLKAAEQEKAQREKDYDEALKEQKKMQ